MPPKKQQQQQGSSSKVKDDKTFGLKNKNKSAKVQKAVQIMQQQASLAGKNKEELAKQKERDRQAQAKLDAEKRKKEEAELFKARSRAAFRQIFPVQVQKVPFGVDPKTVLCVFHKAGHCDKGNKCKFSHDMDIGRKVEKRDLYSDARDEKLDDTMDKWDDEKLKSVVLSKGGNPRTTTDIVCKYFIEAIELQKYGWFWECPDGSERCKYRHALPPGFMLKSQKKAIDDASKANQISLEEFLEVERHKLGSNLTPVTPESFAKWKRTRMDKKQAEADVLKKAKDSQHAAGKLTGMSGRDLFSYNPDWFADEDDEDEGFDLAGLHQHYREDGVGDDEDDRDGQEADGPQYGSDVDDEEQPPDSGDNDGDDQPEAGPSSRPTDT
ncbi:hypothetical protein BKA62DRAFT_611891 [Auriculariales sp. MPI-PUGE-AT-0066]|nr:hypothetical protein BKA62DRAFT_611891 [Auriculariales sp. MPI-PUGE-AT-0066]